MKIYLILLIAFIVLGCKEYTQKSTLSYKDTILARTREIPLTKRGDTSFTYNLMRDIERDLGLDRLIYGYDSMQIRIMLTFSLNPVMQLITLSNRDNTWRAELLEFQSRGINDTSIRYYVTKQRDLMPKSGWPLFIKGLVGKGLTELPDYRTLPNYYYNTDEKMIYIEYATAEFYKVISYPSRPGESNLLPQEIQAEDIIRYLEKELNFERYTRPEINNYEKVCITSRLHICAVFSISCNL